MEKEQAGWSFQNAVRSEPPGRSIALDVVIPLRTPELTAAALEYATTLGQGLDIRLRLIDVHVVPYALPIDNPSVRRDFLENNLRKFAQTSTVPVYPELIFARDWEAGFRRALRPRSLVLLPIRKAWWRSHDKRMAARLRKHGHQVIWVEYE
jgi:hypothetical protein